MNVSHRTSGRAQPRPPSAWQRPEERPAVRRPGRRGRASRLSQAVGRRQDPLLVVGLAVVAGAFGWTAAANWGYGSPAWSAVLPAVEVGPLLWRRRAPVVVLGACVAASVAVAALPAVAFAPAFGVLVAVYTVGAQRSGRAAAASAVLVAAGLPVVVHVLLDAPFPFNLGVVPDEEHLANPLAGAAAFFGGAAALGASVRARRAYTASVLERAERVEAERAEREQRAVLEERSRIARELHDVAAHHLSGLVLQAGALERTVGRDDERARALAREVREGGAIALASMRRLVGLLRAADEEATGRGSQPTLADLADLCARARAAGLEVRATLPPTGDKRRRVPDEVQLAAYRIVQEALSNARQHAPGSRVDVTIADRDGELVAEITDTGAEAGHPAAPANGGRGHGLVGMRERASLLGGTFEAGPRPAGGWRVRAALPLDHDRDAEPR